jgi:AGCS family alanine or glycine:cation symporter
MVTKFAEAVPAVRFRKTDTYGNFVGGPMYIVQQGMGKAWKPIAGIYCFFGVVAAFGVGSATQINAVLGGVNAAIMSFGGRESDLINLIIGIALALLIVSVLYGGARRIGEVATVVVPYASFFYILMCVGVLIVKADAIDDAFAAIVMGAFSPKAVTGGVLGSVFTALRLGASRGVFTNEAGMGTAGIAHASAQVSHPVDQGLMGIIEVFIDTIVICTMTALVILCSGISIPYGNDLGIRITTDAFSAVYGSWVQIPLALALGSFAVATIIGWGLYGTRCAQFLFGERCWRVFAVLQALSVVLGSVLSTGTVWAMSETANGLMAIPNLIILIYFCPEVSKLTAEYKTGSKTSFGGTYENFHQCKSLRTISYEKIPPSCCKGEGRW